MSESASNGIEIWFCNIDTIVTNDSTIDAALTREELVRAGRFAIAPLSRRYRVGRAAIRRILGRWLDQEPRQVDISESDGGKPCVAGGPQFNMSSSGPMLLIGVGASASIGVDIELVRELDDMQQLAERYFSPRECAELESLSESMQMRGFFRAWARKEAVSKALGLGLSMDFTSFSVPLDGLEACSPIVASARFPSQQEWFVKPLPLVTEAESAIASSEPIVVSAFRRITPDMNWSEDFNR